MPKTKKQDHPFDKTLGIKLAPSKGGQARVKLKVRKDHLNHGGIVHGGVLASLCDVALAEAVHKKLKKEQWCVTIQLNIEYLEPGYLGETLYGYGSLKRMGRHLAFVEGGIETADKRQVTKAHGIWFIKKGPSKKIVSKKPIKRMD